MTADSGATTPIRDPASPRYRNAVPTPPPAPAAAPHHQSDVPGVPPMRTAATAMLTVEEVWPTTATCQGPARLLTMPPRKSDTP